MSVAAGRLLAIWLFAAAQPALFSCVTTTQRPVAAQASPRAIPAGVDAMWTHMNRALPGAWKATTDGGAPISETLESISAESALVETYVTATGKKTMSVYHRDGADLVLTHYCAQGNQPRLRVASVGDDRVVFRLADATNVMPGQAMLIEKELRFRADGFDQIETYRGPDGVLAVTTLRFGAE